MISANDELRSLAEDLIEEEAEGYLAAPALYRALQNLLASPIRIGNHPGAVAAYRKAQEALTLAKGLEHDGHCTCNACLEDLESRTDYPE
jgi:hypothetical protein